MKVQDMLRARSLHPSSFKLHPFLAQESELSPYGRPSGLDPTLTLREARFGDSVAA